MDQNRNILSQEHKGSSSWHYDDIPVCDSLHQDELFPNGNCATEKIEPYFDILSDSDATKENWILALRLLVHMVSDIHQPLHAADHNNRGGNQVSVKINNQKTNLHKAWDTVFVKAALRGISKKKLAENFL